MSPTTNIQAKKTISVTGEGGLTANFDGAGWELKRGNSYAAYSPFNGTMPSETPYTAVPIDMTGQVQNGNASLTHIGDKYDYMYASSVVPSEGNVNFAFDHACAIAIFELTMPVAGAWTTATLTAGSDVFTTKATMNVSTGAVTATEKASSITLGLNNVSTTAENKKLTLYLSVLPTTTGSLTLTLKDSEGKEYTATLASKTLAAGRAYAYGNVSQPLMLGSTEIPDFYIGWLYCNDGEYLIEGEFNLHEELVRELGSIKGSSSPITWTEDYNGTPVTFTYDFTAIDSNIEYDENKYSKLHYPIKSSNKDIPGKFGMAFIVAILPSALVNTLSDEEQIFIANPENGSIKNSFGIDNNSDFIAKKKDLGNGYYYYIDTCDSALSQEVHEAIKLKSK